MTAKASRQNNVRVSCAAGIGSCRSSQATNPGIGSQAQAKKIHNRGTGCVWSQLSHRASRILKCFTTRVAATSVAVGCGSRAEPVLREQVR
jgi:hypothetical protein